MSTTKKGVANFQKILVTSFTGVKIQSISLITNIEIQFMNSVKIIESNFYTSFYYIEMLYHLARSMAV